MRGWVTRLRSVWPPRPYPVLIPVAFVLTVVADNGTSIWAGARPIVLLAVLGLGLTLALSAWLRERDRASFLALLVMVVISRGADWRIPAAVGPAFVLLFFEYRLSRPKPLIPWPAVGGLLSVISVALVAVLVAQIVQSQAFGPTPRAQPAWTAAAAAPATPRPNIYLVLLDGHGRADVLLNSYGLDESAFLGDLDGLGFGVASQSQANYMVTRFSLTSFLNGAHLEALGVDSERALSDPVLTPALENNAAFAFARRAGYRLISVASGWEAAALRSADEFIDVGPFNDLEGVLEYNSALRPVAEGLIPDLDAFQKWGRTEGNLATLEQLSARATDRPRLALVHLPVPHWPYSRDADCEPILSIAVPPLPDHDGLDFAQQYRATLLAREADQSTCLHSMLVPVLERVVANDPGAVVILFSDHGPEINLSWANPSPRGIRERLANLFAARTPGQTDLFPDDVTLVNVLPILFNGYFGTSLPLSPDDRYVGPDPDSGGITRLSDAP